MTLENLQIDSAAISDKGLSEKRPQNEDSYLELRDSGLYAVADGVGGAQAGDVASQMAVEILGEGFINLQEDGDAEERMKAAIDQANSAIYRMSNELQQLSTMATTIVAVHINGNIATIGHVGDSRLYRLDKDGNLFRETQDHSVVEEEVRAGRMTPEQALTHPSRNVISRALGAEQTVEIDMKTIMFEPGTKFLVCSDGVTRHIPDEELRSLLMEDSDSFLTCHTIKELCYQRGALDNLTAIIVSITEAIEDDFVGSADLLEDFEQDTVATARPPLVNSSLLANRGTETVEIPTQDFATTQNLENETPIDTNDPHEDEEIIIPTKNDGSEERISISTQTDLEIEKREASAKKDIKSYRVDEKGGNGVVGSIISGILWLLIGAVIGALGYHFGFSNSNNDVVGVSQPITTKMTTPVFEENKRLAITDSKRFIADMNNPKTAYDNYLLGLAQINVQNFEGAKNSLQKAQEMLKDIPEGDREVLENDISFALNKVDNANSNKESEKPVGEVNNEEVKPKIESEKLVEPSEPTNNAPIGNDG